MDRRIFNTRQSPRESFCRIFRALCIRVCYYYTFDRRCWFSVTDFTSRRSNLRFRPRRHTFTPNVLTAATIRPGENNRFCARKMTNCLVIVLIKSSVCTITNRRLEEFKGKKYVKHLRETPGDAFGNFNNT